MIGFPSTPQSPLRRAMGQLDWVLIFVTLALSTFGVLMIFSSIQTNTALLEEALHWKQLTWISAGVVSVAFILLFDYHHFTRLAYIFYFLLVALLVLVLISGKIVYGAKRWLILGPMRLQPSEFTRLAIILVLARYFGSRENTAPLEFRDLILPFIFVAIPCTLVARQPDLGTSLMTVMVAALMLIIVGVRTRVFLSIAAMGFTVAPVGWFFLRDYQKNRILTVLNPEADPLGSGYQSLQSKIAVGSGGFWGKGLFQGTQSRLHFLPEKHTDFIFSVLSEELGFIGATVLLILFLIFIHRCVQTALNAGDKEGLLIAVGVATSFFLYIFLNIGMTVGLIPIAGMPLSLVSYGGSSALASFLAIGLLLNVRLRRRNFVSLS